MTPLVGPLAALIAGILVSPLLDPYYVWLTLPLAILLAFARKWGLLLSFFLLGAGLRSNEPPVPPDPGDTATRIQGTLTKAPEWRGLGAYLDVELDSIDGRPYRGRARLTEFLEDDALLNMFNALALGTGDHVEIVARLQRPAVYRDPGVFNYRRYLERQQIYWTGNIRNPRLITVQARGWHGMDRLKAAIARRLERPFSSEPAARGLVMGMVLGRKYGLPAETERDFQAGGLYHLVVVSGFNLAVIAAVAFGIAKRLPLGRTSRLIFVLVAALGYAALVEGQAPVNRAALMVCFLIASKLLDRGYSVGNSIAGTAILALLVDPTSLEDSSFQMTFAAVIAVTGLGSPLVKWSLGWLTEALSRFDNVDVDGRLSPEIADWRVSRRLWCELKGVPHWAVTVPWRLALILAETALMSVCVELVFVVFMVESFHRISPVSPLLNVPAALVATAVTPLGLAAIVLPQPLSGMCAWISTHLLNGLIALVELALKLPGATFRVPAVPLSVWVLYGVGVGALTWTIHRRKVRWAAGVALLVVGVQGVIAFGNFAEAAPGEVTATFIDVGQGDSTLVEFPDGRRMLIDGGGVAAGRFLNLRDEATFSVGESVVSPFLWSKGLRRLDTVVLTHAHNDHLDGLLNVLENFEVGELWLGRNPMVPAYRKLVTLALERQIPLRWVVEGDQVGDFRVLHPPANWKPKKGAENDDSVVLLLDTGKVTALFTGDIERRIVAPERVDVLKVSHHGSRGVKLQVKAAVRVIEVGANNPFGHPHPSTLPALRTDQLGAITVTLSKVPEVGSWLTSPGRWGKLALLLEGH